LVSQVLYYEALLWTVFGDCALAAVRARESIKVSVRVGERWATPAGEMALGAALTGLGELEKARTVLEGAASHASALRQNWIAGMSELLLARAWLAPTHPAPANALKAAGGAPAGPDPVAALRAVGAALIRFREEDDVGNVLSCLHTGAHAITLGGEPARGATLLAAVRRHGSRRGLRPDLTDPATTAALDAALRQALEPAQRAAADADGAILDEAAMIAMLPAGQDQGHARR
jgi:hypothetical protein